MEPANTQVVYTIETSVVRIRWVIDQWFVQLRALGVSIGFGEERPALDVGDRVTVQIRRQDAKDIGTSIQ